MTKGEMIQEYYDKAVELAELEGKQLPNIEDKYWNFITSKAIRKSTALSYLRGMRAKWIRAKKIA